MCPTLFRIGSFEAKSFSLMILIGIAVAIWLGVRRTRLYGLDPSRVMDSSMWMVVLGVLGARIAFIIQDWDFFSKNPQHLWTFKFEGLTSFGGFILGFVGLVIYCWRAKVPLLSMMDVLGVPLLVANAIGRLGCLLNGCCYGISTTGPLGVHFHGEPGLHLPAQLIDFSLCMLGAWVVARWEKRKSGRAGQSAGLALVMLGLSRFVYEFWRMGSVEEVRKGLASSTRIGALPFTEAHVVALIISLLGVGLYVLSRKRSESREPATMQTS